MVIPSIGINSFQGDSGEGTGVGLRVGLLAGSRFTERFSFNLGLAFDKVNEKALKALIRSAVALNKYSGRR